MSDVSEAAEFLIIRGEEHLVIAAGAHGDDIVHVRVLRVKVEDKDQTAALIGQHMVVLAEQLQLRGPFAEKAGIPDCVDPWTATVADGVNNRRVRGGATWGNSFTHMAFCLGNRSSAGSGYDGANSYNSFRVAWVAK